MRHEYEATFLSIDVADLQAKLAALGATQAFPRRLSPGRSSSTAPSTEAPGSGCATKASDPR